MLGVKSACNFIEALEEHEEEETASSPKFGGSSRRHCDRHSYREFARYLTLTIHTNYLTGISPGIPLVIGKIIRVKAFSAIRSPAVNTLTEVDF